ncbi:MAG: sulfur oxidation c-type cytochrome SoxX [Gammaproteobacteria bacterium]|nr:sulfur oxidation c-type cytochrome SoxX [Gammaproteobacteria bacterium]
MSISINSGRFRISILLAVLFIATSLSAQEYLVENFAITEPLTGEAGDPERGQSVMIERDLGNCLGCHEVPVDAEFFGTTGPTLAGVGDRLTPAQLRLRLVDSKQFNPMSMMPSYYKTEGLHRVQKEFEGKTVLSAQQIEDIIAFLVTLKRQK